MNSEDENENKPLAPFLPAVFIGWGGYTRTKKYTFPHVWPDCFMAFSKSGIPIVSIDKVETHSAFSHWSETICSPGDVVWLPRYDYIRFNKAAVTNQFAIIEWHDRILAWWDAGVNPDEMLEKLKDEDAIIKPLPGYSQPNTTKKKQGG